ncbi:unnamed protein product [Angiostrongylus costaricensis]|uniref:Ima1_N domain-containing protein n=1 Tax=Angiostrongylus costaricensis TaxID=334426 RepID=A0A0R3PU88_ANGCS|nr:unnamed protein product [Angiostrongylus costaricensis]
MEMIVAAAACMVAPLVYRSLRKHLYTKVNCWFCQHDQRVPFEQRNSFTCASCEQYNGFDESGDYNRKIPGQHCAVALKPTRRFCASNVSATRPDVSQEGNGNNGLCDNCNRQQEIILRRIAEFEPSDDNQWNEEVEIYRYKLNKAYPLCVRCTFFAQDKMQEEKKRHANLLRLKNTFANSVRNDFTSAANVAVKIATRRRRFFAGGYIAETMHFTSFVLSTLLFLSQFNFLQEEMDWEPSLNRVSSDATVVGGLRPSEVMKRLARESTPSRQLAPSLASLSLLGDSYKTRSGFGVETQRRGPFYSPHSVYHSYAPSIAPSRFSVRLELLH